MVALSRADSRSDEARGLSERSWAEQHALYPDLDRDEFLAVDFTGAGAAFVIARRRGRAVGCGAILPLCEAIGEVRRMFVEPEARRLRIGWKILDALEQLARDLNYESLRLETGTSQPAAIALYEAAGFSRIAPYSRYKNDPRSVCFEKSVVRSDRSAGSA